MRQRNYWIKQRVPSELPTAADLTKVCQSLLNFLSNAAEFTHQGEIHLI